MEKILPFLDKQHTVEKIQKILAEEDIDFDAFKELIGEEFKQLGKAKKKGQTETFDDVLLRVYRTDLE